MLPDFRVRQRDYLLEIARAITQELDLEKLLARMKDPAAPPTVTSFLPELIVRKSCGGDITPDLILPSLGRIELAPTGGESG